MGLLNFNKARKRKSEKDREIRDGDPYIFVSYALADADEVYGIIGQFQDRGYRVWYDEGVVPGDEKADVITAALEHAALFMVFLSLRSEALVKVRREIDFALNAGKPFLAIYLKETNLTGGLQLRLAAQEAVWKYHLSDEEFYDQCSVAFEHLGLSAEPSARDAEIVLPEPAAVELSEPAETVTVCEENPDSDKMTLTHYDKADREHMRKLLQKSSVLIDLIAEDRVRWGSPESAELIDRLADGIGNENEKQKDEYELQELKDDRYSLINLYAGIKKEPAFLPLYSETGKLLRKYGLFDEEAVLLENAIAGGGFSEKDLDDVKKRLEAVVRYREADDAAMTGAERTAANLRRALQKRPPDVSQIKTMLEQCSDDAVLYDIACNTDRDPDMVPVREKAARLISSRDYQYAFSSHIYDPARTSMILDLHESLRGDELFIARTILTDPNDENKTHMLLYCEDEELLMLGWKYVYGARRFCTDRLHAIGSDYPEKYENSDPQERAEWEENWFICAGETALEIIPEDEAVRDRLPGTVTVDSEPLHFYLSLMHTRKAIRWWHAKKLKNPVYIAYAGSWTSDDQIKEALSVRINSTELITEMIYGDLSGADLVFGFRKPEDLTLQDRFCIEIMKNNPDRTIREHVRKELLRGNIEIPGVDLSKPDPLYTNSFMTDHHREGK